MKFRTKPFTIEAVQWKGHNVQEIKDFTGWDEDRGEDNFLLPDEVWGNWDDPHIYDYLHKTWIAVNTGDFIIRGMKNEFYPCNPEVFWSKYEEVHNG